MLHRCSRYDFQGKELLKTQEKFYLADTALRYSVLGYHDSTVAASLENVVYLELSAADIRFISERMVTAKLILLRFARMKSFTFR